jgi:hypothetical protein
MTTHSRRRRTRSSSIAVLRSSLREICISYVRDAAVTLLHIKSMYLAESSAMIEVQFLPSPLSPFSPRRKKSKPGGNKGGSMKPRVARRASLAHTTNTPFGSLIKKIFCRSACDPQSSTDTDARGENTHTRTHKHIDFHVYYMHSYIHAYIRLQVDGQADRQTGRRTDVSSFEAADPRDSERRDSLPYPIAGNAQRCPTDDSYSHIVLHHLSSDQHTLKHTQSPYSITILYQRTQVHPTELG